VAKLAESQAAWALPWPCIHEFLAIVTHPRIYKPPTPLTNAIEQVEAWLESPSVILLSELEDYWLQLRPILLTGRVSGPQIHDARVVALCKHHGITELWTADRDFGRFPGIRLRNPLLE
jgi:predicted nucleic acid-binding protein